MRHLIDEDYGQEEFKEDLKAFAATMGVISLFVAVCTYLPAIGAWVN